MAEVLHENLKEIEASDVHQRLGLEKGKYILLSAHREENIDTEKNFLSLFNAINKLAEKYDMPILYSCHPRSRNRLAASGFACVFCAVEIAVCYCAAVISAHAADIT